MTILLHYDCLAEFKRQFYKDLLTHEHVQGGQIKIDKLSFPDGSVDDTANFWGWILQKDGIKYLLSSTDDMDREIKLKEILPIRAKGVQKVASKGVVYQWIREPVSAKFRPERTKSFKEFVHTLAAARHSNPRHQTLQWLKGLSQMMDRANYRDSTPAGFGKDSVVDTCGNLFGGSGTIENPTIAKLEERAYTLKWLAVNETVGIAKANWEIIQEFLLSTGAFKPEVTKRSRSFGAVGETIDISTLSLSLLYNDIDHYEDMSVYFDFVTKDAVLDRFPAFRLYGRFTEDFTTIKSINVPQYVKDNIDKYRDLIGNFMYYKQNLFHLLHKWDTSRLNKLDQRHSHSINILLKTIDLYCETQEEFDSWIDTIHDSMHDYKVMLEYPEWHTAVYDIAKQVYPPKGKDTAGKYLEWAKDFEKRLTALPTFIERNELCRTEVIALRKPKGPSYTDQPWSNQAKLLQEVDKDII